MIRVCQWCDITMGYTTDHKHGDLRETSSACDSCMSIHDPAVYQKILELRAKGEVEHA
jgi:hypothetical protein